MKAGTVLAAVAAIACVVPASAAADQRYASPGGSGVACTQSAPCGFETAVEDAADGDDVIVEPGTYALASEVVLDTTAVVHGDEGRQRPTISSTATTAIRVMNPAGPGGELRWLDVTHSGGGDALFLEEGSARLLSVHSTTPQLACRVDAATLQDSVCRATGPGGDAAGTVAGPGTEAAALVNVTAFASGAGSAGIRVQSVAGGQAEFLALNVIAKGAVDTEVLSTPTSITVANFDYSNFETQTVDDPAHSFPSAPGSASNQTTPPIFNDAAAGDFHQDPSSPTVDRGTLEGIAFTPSDLDGEARIQGFGIDIGADELFVGPLPPDTNPPDTRILKRPGARTSHRRAKFRFGTTEPVNAVFMCSLDKKAFEQCKSEMKVRVKRGKRHSMAVYSIDEAGNVDPTPDSYSWKVKRKQDDD